MGTLSPKDWLKEISSEKRSGRSRDRRGPRLGVLGILKKENVWRVGFLEAEPEVEIQI